MEKHAGSVTVAIVALSGAAHLERCINALDAQECAPPFDIVVASNPDLPGVTALLQRYPHVRTVGNHGKTTPYELTSLALDSSTSEIILLTEDHCEPKSDWVRQLCAAMQQQDVPAAGGVVEPNTKMSSIDWAYYFSDYYGYAKPVTQGPARSLTVCNVAYRRSCLHEIAHLWNTFFNEPVVNRALCERHGLMWLTADAEVKTHRRVALADALRERYAFGRLLGYTRCDSATAVRRACYAILTPAVPLLILSRITQKALKGQGPRRRLLRSFPALTMLAIAWAWGECLGYISHKPPRSLNVAPEKSEPEPKTSSVPHARTAQSGKTP